MEDASETPANKKSREDLKKKGRKIQPPESWLKTNLPISNILKKMVDKCVDTKTIDP